MSRVERTISRVIDVAATSELGWESAAMRAVYLAYETTDHLKSVVIMDIQPARSRGCITHFRVATEMRIEIEEDAA